MKILKKILIISLLLIVSAIQAQNYDSINIDTVFINKKEVITKSFLKTKDLKPINSKPNHYKKIKYYNLDNKYLGKTILHHGYHNFIAHEYTTIVKEKINKRGTEFGLVKTKKEIHHLDSNNYGISFGINLNEIEVKWIFWNDSINSQSISNTYNNDSIFIKKHHTKGKLNKINYCYPDFFNPFKTIEFYSNGNVKSILFNHLDKKGNIKKEEKYSISKEGILINYCIGKWKRNLIYQYYDYHCS